MYTNKMVTLDPWLWVCGIDFFFSLEGGDEGSCSDALFFGSRGMAKEEWDPPESHKICCGDPEEVREVGL